MTKEKSQNPILWLDVKICELTYVTYSKIAVKHNREPLPNFSTRYDGALESIVESTKYKAEKLEYDIPSIATCYFTHLVKSQAHYNGNKRMGVMYTLIFLEINGYEFVIPENELSIIALMIAKDTTLRTNEVENYLIPYFKKFIKKK